VLLTQGSNIDLGAVAKGYIGQKIADELQKEGSDFGILSLGGNMQLYGNKADGSNWNIAIQDPLDESSIVGIISTTDCSVITSGSYQRYFIEENIVYHHILDPKTGYPADSGLISVTIVARDGAYADALSTGLFVTGLEKGIEIWKEYKDFEAVFITVNNEIYITEGLKGRFSSESESYLFEYIYK
jgi:thiamine biosynthesis lipoprotein